VFTEELFELRPHSNEKGTSSGFLIEDALRPFEGLITLEK